MNRGTSLAVAATGLRRTIIYVGGFELPDGNAAAQRVVSNARILKDLGFQVILVGVSSRIEPGSPIQRAAIDSLPFECWEIAYPANAVEWFRRIISVGSVAPLLQAHSADVATVICYDFPAVAQARIRRLAHRVGAKAIAEVTEWYGVSRLNGIASVAKNLDRPLRMRIVNPTMDGLIVASRFLADYYAAYGKPILVLPTLMDAQIAAEPADLRHDGPVELFFAGSGFEPAIIRAARDGPKDRLDGVIEALGAAMENGANFRLSIYGVARNDYLEIMPEHAGLLTTLGERVVFHGRQPRSQVRQALARSDYSIFLRADTIATRAGFPTKFAESIHYGTPVLTNRVGSVVDHAIEGRTGHYISEDPAEAGAQLAGIFSRPDGAAELKRHCSGSAMFHYSKYGRPMSKFIADVLGRALSEAGG